MSRAESPPEPGNRSALTKSSGSSESRSAHPGELQPSGVYGRSSSTVNSDTGYSNIYRTEARVWIKRLLARGQSISGAFASASKWPAFSVTNFDSDGWADFHCAHCGRRVARGRKHIPDSCFTMLFLACACGTVTFFEGDPGPTNAADWRAAIEILRVSGSEILVLNLNPSDKGTSLGRN